MQNNKLDSLKNKVSTKGLSIQKRANAIYNLAKYEFELGQFEYGKKDFQNAIALYQSIGDYHGVLKVTVEMGMHHQQQNHFDKALESYYGGLDALEYLEDSLPKKDFILYQGIVLMDISIIFGEVQYYDAALSYGLNAEKLLAMSDSVTIATSTSNIGAIYLGLNQYKEALNYFNKAIIYFGSDNEMHEGLTSTYTNIGNIYHKLKEYDKALTYYQKVLNFYNQ